MPRSLDEAVAEANAQGLAIHNLFQMPDGSWRACLKVFGALPHLGMNPVYMNYADGDDPAECIDRAIATSTKIAWKKPAAEAVAAMADGTCTATLWAKDRATVNAKKIGHHNRPETSESPPKPKRDVLAETEELLRKKAPESVAGSRRKTLEDKLSDLL